jgi:Kazal-type serine protease inhibitor domain
MIFRWAALFAVVWAIFAGSAPTPVAAQTPALVGPCAAIYDPVCGRKKTHMITYANACLAGHDRATVLARGACPQACSMIYKPVCGEDAQGVRRNYGNACAATADGAKIVRHRRCFVTFGRR